MFDDATTGRAVDPWGDFTVADLIEHITRRASAMPSLVAIRYGADALTYSDLLDLIGRYLSVSRAHGMSDESGVVAAVMFGLPATAEDRSGVAVAEVIGWIGRGIDSVDSARLAV